jgi:glycosyltransferase involved in cell wall biosynthesis
MADPRVTVIIPTYNRAETLRYAIESVLWQEFQDYELWVIGDCCTDHTEQVVKSFNDPRVQWYNLPKNSGYQSEPNNEGIRRARGKYIAYLNHDDVWLPNHLKILYQHIESSGADIVYAIMEWILSFAPSYPDIPKMPYLPRSPEATALMHKKTLVDDIGYWKGIKETHAYPRVEFLRRAQFAGKRFEIVPFLTSLKFLWDEKNYTDVGPQPLMMEKVRNDPDFVHRELAGMLIRAYGELESVTSLKRFKRQIMDRFRELCMKRNIDPAKLYFWEKPGKQIRIWRKRHKLAVE